MPGTVQGRYGTYTDYGAITDKEAGDPLYNERQGEFEQQTDWDALRKELQSRAAQAGVAYDESDLQGIQRNAGYDASHQGAGGGYAAAIDRSLANATQNYAQRADNAPGGGGTGGGSTRVSQAWNAQPKDGRADDFYRQLLARSQQGLAVDRNDPTIRAQADAFGAQQDRSRGEYLNDLAESRGPYANLLGEQRLTAERAGQQRGAFEAQLMGREVAARRDEIAQALQLMAGQLSTSQTLALQRELGLLDSELRRLGLSNTYDLGMRNLALNGWIAGDNSERAWAGI